MVEVGDDLPVEQQDLVLPVQRDPLRRHAGRHRPVPHRQHIPRLPTHTRSNDPPSAALPAHGATSTTTRPDRARGAGRPGGGADSASMDEHAASVLVAELAALAGRRIDDYEIAAVLAWSQEMPAQRANDIWRRHHAGPTTVSLRDYLAMTLCFINQAPPT